MKNCFWVILTMLAIMSIGHAQTQFHAEPVVALEAEGPAPTATWAMEMHDFGSVPQGTPITHIFEFTNTGNKPIQIESVKPSCGCTAADYSREAVAPGETGYIKVEYNAASKGLFTKSIVVRSNAAKPVMMLKIKGEVVPKSEQSSNTE